MSLLITNPPQYSRCYNNLTGFRSFFIPPGTMVSPGISNALGPVNTLLPRLDSDVSYIIIGISNLSVASAAYYALVDVMIDRAGGTNWETNPIISGLVGGFTPVVTAGGNAPTVWYQFPLCVCSGSSLGVRAQTSHTTTAGVSGIITCFAYGGALNASSQWVGQGVETLGVNRANSQGRTITPGNAGAWGSFGVIGTGTKNYKFLQFGINGSDATALAQQYFWQLGIASGAMSGVPTFWTSTSTSEVSTHIGLGLPIWTNVPSGTIIQARGRCSGTGEAYNFAVYGVY